MTYKRADGVRWEAGNESSLGTKDHLGHRGWRAAGRHLQGRAAVSRQEREPRQDGGSPFKQTHYGQTVPDQPERAVNRRRRGAP